jgi:hypothetical protein
MRAGSITFLALMAIALITTPAQCETVPVCQYTVSFELPLPHLTRTDERHDNPSICRINLYTPENNQIAPITITTFGGSQDASRQAMETAVRDLLLDCGTISNTIYVSEYAIDQCYCIKGKGSDFAGKSWVAAYCWLDRRRDGSGGWIGYTGCSIVSNYPNSDDFLSSLNILQ